MIWRVLRESKVRATSMSREHAEDTLEMLGIQNQQPVETLPTNRPHESLRDRVLPWTGWRRQDLSDTHPCHSLAERLAVGRVPIAQQPARRRVMGKASMTCCAVQAAVGCSVMLK